MVSPHFPPDSSAAAHRVRLLAPHLPRHGWEPTVLTVDPRAYETRLDPDLARLVPAHLRVLRARAMPARLTRLVGVGDLGLRALPGLRRASAALLRRERFDAVFITTYPTYPALIGPWLKRAFGVPFVLDCQDPWVGAWGRSTGGGADGVPDLKSRLSRALAVRLERRAARAADAVTAVSPLIWEEMRARVPEIAGTPCAAIPLGAEAGDFAALRGRPPRRAYFDPEDGDVHVCSVGTLLPLGIETLRAVLGGVAALRDGRPELYRRLRLHFFGTSNQTAAEAAPRVLPVARALGVADRVTEVAPRVDYLDALAILTRAGAILAMGSSEPHYTASRLYPAVLAARPLLAVYHEASSGAEALRRIARPPAVRLVTYTDAERAPVRAGAIAAALSAVLECPAYDSNAVDVSALEAVSARAMAGELSRVLARVVDGSRAVPVSFIRP